MSTDVFVSHISEEAELAARLKTMLEDLFAGDVGVFTSSDRESIPSGEAWFGHVTAALQRAKVLVVLCSKASVQRSWVQFEVGAAWMREGMHIVPLCHSDMRLTDLQAPLNYMQGCDVTIAGLDRLVKAVAKAAGTKRTFKAEDLQPHLLALQAEEQKFKAHTVTQFERFIDILIPRPGSLETPEVPDAAVVESNDESLELFGLIRPEEGTLAWRTIKKAARKTLDQRWVQELERCIYLASNNERFKPVQAIFHNDTGSYQPQLSKKEVMRDGTCRFHVHLIETVVAPLKDVPNEFALMATLLKLGLRFRYEVIQRFNRKLMAFKGSLPDLVAECRHAVETIETDALSRGCEMPDVGMVLDLFRTDEDQLAIRKLQDDWDTARAVLFDDSRSGTAAEVRDVISKMREVNIVFMTIGTRRFHEMIVEGWR